MNSRMTSQSRLIFGILVLFAATGWPLDANARGGPANAHHPVTTGADKALGGYLVGPAATPQKPAPQTRSFKARAPTNPPVSTHQRTEPAPRRVQVTPSKKSRRQASVSLDLQRMPMAQRWAEKIRTMPPAVAERAVALVKSAIAFCAGKSGEAYRALKRALEEFELPALQRQLAARPATT
jgi:hypothetical protein